MSENYWMDIWPFELKHQAWNKLGFFFPEGQTNNLYTNRAKCIQEVGQYWKPALITAFVRLTAPPRRLKIDSVKQVLQNVNFDVKRLQRNIKATCDSVIYFLRFNSSSRVTHHQPRQSLGEWCFFDWDEFRSLIKACEDNWFWNVSIHLCVAHKQIFSVTTGQPEQKLQNKKLKV